MFKLIGCMTYIYQMKFFDARAKKKQGKVCWFKK